MKPQDYKALQIFVTEVDQRFKGMQDTINNFIDVIKKNRDAIEKIHEDIDGIIEILADNKAKFEEFDDTKKDVNERLLDLSKELEEFEQTMIALNEVTSVIDDGSPTDLMNAVNRMVNPNAPQPSNTPIAPQQQPISLIQQKVQAQQMQNKQNKSTVTPPQPNPIPQPIPQPNPIPQPIPQQQAPIQPPPQQTQPIQIPPKQTGIYSEDELMKMGWAALKKLAGTYGCKKINGGRDFYVEFVLNQQNAIKGGTT